MRNIIKTTIFLTISILAITMSSLAIADNSTSNYKHGLYLGAQLNWVELHNSHANVEEPILIVFPISFLADQMGGRANLGYRFNDYFAIEAGYNGLADSGNTGGALNYKNRTRIKGIDLTGKIIYPTPFGLSVFGKFGAAYVKQDILESINYGNLVIYKNKTAKVMPLVGAGLSYNFTPAFAIDATWTHLFQSGAIQNIDTTGLGLSYTF